MNIGTRIKMLRLESGKTQEDLAKILDVDRVTVTQYEQNQRKPSLDVLKKLVDTFQVSADYILGLTEDKSLQRPKKTVYNELPAEAKKLLADFEDLVFYKYCVSYRYDLAVPEEIREDIVVIIEKLSKMDKNKLSAITQIINCLQLYSTNKIRKFGSFLEEMPKEE